MHHARDEHDEPVFLIKGGVAIELLLGLRARATKDLDAEACVEIFRLRAKHTWPPRIKVLPEWPDGYRSLAEQLGFAPPDVHQAAIDVQAIVARIDAARSAA